MICLLALLLGVQPALAQAQSQSDDIAEMLKLIDTEEDLLKSRHAAMASADGRCWQTEGTVCPLERYRGVLELNQESREKLNSVAADSPAAIWHLYCAAMSLMYQTSELEKFEIVAHEHGWRKARYQWLRLDADFYRIAEKYQKKLDTELGEANSFIVGWQPDDPPCFERVQH